MMTCMYLEIQIFDRRRTFHLASPDIHETHHVTEAAKTLTLGSNGLAP